MQRSLEQIVKDSLLKQALAKYAEKDLTAARNAGEITLINTKRGTIQIKWYINHTYMIVQNGYAFFRGRKAGAIKWLVDNYEVVND